MAEHKTTCTDEDVILHGGRGTTRGTVARCECGWKSSWWVQDGSAEADADMHMRANDQEYRERRQAEEEQWAAEHAERESQRVARLEEFWKTEPLGPERKPSEPCHSCTCFISPPCGNCEDCKHIGAPDCPNDCQTCEYDHWRTGPYKLDDGDERWSDRVVRHWRIRSFTWQVNNPGRAFVYQECPHTWTAAIGYHSEWQRFNTHAEAIAYADRTARGKQ